MYIYIIWANYNDLTATSLEPWLVREIFPKWPYFRLVKYYNLPRYYRHISVRFVNFPGELTTLQGLTMARCLQEFVPGRPGETTCSGGIGTPGWQASRCGIVAWDPSWLNFLETQIRSLTGKIPQGNALPKTEKIFNHT